MPLTLRDIVARGTPLEWFESVAIVQELGATIRGRSGGAELHVPDLPGIVVTPDGGVDVTEVGSPDRSPAFRLAHVLNALLANASPPVQLRLLVLTALAPEPTYGSLHELSQALEYFERPDRRDVVRAVYERASRLPAVEVAVPPVPDGPPKPAPPPPSPERLRRRRLVVQAAALTVMAAAAAGAGWWWLSRPSGAKMLNDTTQTVSRAVSSAVGAIKGTFGTRTEAPSVVEAAPSQPPARQGPFRRGSRPIQPVRSLAHGGIAPIVALAPTIERTTWTEPAEKFDETIFLNIPATEAAGADIALVYSESDSDVIPPVAVHPKLPTEPPVGVGTDELTRLEIIVSESGEVDSVKIVAGPRRTTDGMMLSAVKAWRFRPAIRNGHPVPYRRLVWLTNP